MSIAITTAPDGAISNYDDLVTEIAAWMDRDDLTARIPTFLRIAENRLNRMLRVPDMETSAQLAIAAADVDLPTGFLAMRSLYLEGTPNSQLANMSVDALPTITAATGNPQAYAIIGNRLKVAPVPTSTVYATLVYFKEIPALTSGAPSNWLLDKASDIYVFGALLAATAFMGDASNAVGWKALYDEAVSELIGAGNRARWGGGPIAPRSATQVRGAVC